MKKRLLLLTLLFSFGGILNAQTTRSTEFSLFLAKLDSAQIELQNGKVDAFKSLWSHSDDVTLSGGFGGTIEKGWPAISKRLDWVAANFSKGTNRIERLVSTENGSLGYVVQLEHISFVAPETGKNATRDYRVTMVFSREKSGWKLVHRQADSLFTKQAPQ